VNHKRDLSLIAAFHTSSCARLCHDSSALIRFTSIFLTLMISQVCGMYPI
jgi:hypothetical protein